MAPDSPAAQGTGWRRVLAHPLIIGGGLVAMTLAVYWPALGFEYINFDDPDYISGNTRVLMGLTWDGVRWAFTTWDVGIWHPLTWISLMLDVTLFGKGPAGPHGTNLLLHTLNTLLLFGLLRRMTGATWRSAWVAAIFALHPLHVESVAWITERKDVLSTFFGLAAMGAYAGYVRTDGRGCCGRCAYYWMSLVFYGLSLMAKPTFVTLPFVLLLLDWWPLQRPALASWPVGPAAFGRLLSEKAPFVVLAVAMSVSIIWQALSQERVILPFGSPGLLSRLENAVVSYAFYIGKTLWPSRLAVFYPPVAHWPLPLVLGFLILGAGVTAAAIRWGRAHRYGIAGWFWFVIMLVPMSGIVRVGIGHAMADRYMYVPMVGLLISAAWGLAAAVGRWRGGGLWLGVIGVVTTAACGAATAIQLPRWRDSETLFRSALNVTQNNAMAHHCLGMTLNTQGRTDEAMRHYLETVRLAPDLAEGQHNLAHHLSMKGRQDEAVEHYRRALALKPGFAEAWSDLGSVLAAQGKREEALQCYRKAVSLKPDLAEGYHNLGVVLAGQGNRAEALAAYRRAVALKPGMAEAHNNLAALLAAGGQTDEAIGHYRKALSARPGFVEAHYNLAALLAATGRTEEAVTHYVQALKVRPDFVQARNDLGLALATLGRADEAIAQYRLALKTSPGDVSVQNNLAWLLATAREAGVRNGAEAVEWAERARKLTQGKAPVVLDTLAAAYAEQGRFAEAVVTAGEAVELARTAGDANLAAQLQARLELYREGQPFREKVPAGP